MIKFETIIKEKEYRERVIKYFRLPMRLSVSQEKFISDLEFMKLIDENKVNEIIKLTEIDFNSEVQRQNTNNPDFTMEYVLEPIVNDFANNENWQTFIQKDYSNVLDDYQGITNTHGFYKKENNNKCFLSIDLVSANWQSLQHILNIEDTYENLIVKHTNNLIPSMSKTMRTKITGLLDAKKIMDYNKKLLLDNQKQILDIIGNIVNMELANRESFAFYADEFLIELNEEELSKLYSQNYELIETQVYELTGIKIHFVPFKLKWLALEKGCIKIYKDKKSEILNLSKDVLLMINKKMHNVDLKDIDFEKIKKTDKLLNEMENAIKIIKNI